MGEETAEVAQVVRGEGGTVVGGRVATMAAGEEGKSYSSRLLSMH